jgi:predicted dehydrogenase
MINRRSFLTTAAGSLTLGAVPRLLAADLQRIGIGLLGASYSHAKGKLQVIQASTDWKLVGVAESDPKIRETLTKQGIAVMSREELLRHPDIQVIAVESAVRDHAADGKAVLTANKHLHLEKAPATNMADFQEIVTLSRSRGLLLQVGYMWRYHPGISKALEAAKNGWLGPVHLLRANICNELAAARRPEWAEFFGGVMFELGGHVIDPMVRLMGKPEKVTGRLRHESTLNDKLADNTVAILEWERTMGIVQASTLQPDSGRFRAFEVHGGNGVCIVNPIEPAALSVDMITAAGPYKAGVQEIALPPYRRYEADLIDLAAAVRKEHGLKVSSEEDLMVQETLLRCSGMA